MNPQNDILDNDVDGIKSVGQAAVPVVKQAGQAMVERNEAAVIRQSDAPMVQVERAARFARLADEIQERRAAA